MAIDLEGTILVLSGIGIPPYSATGLTQTLTPIADAGQISRSINGAAMDMSASQFRKYESEITCTDQNAPALDGIWPGALVTVDCVCELAYETSTAGAERTVVSGSERVSGDFTYYRPRLNMMVVSKSQSDDEWPNAIAWKLNLVEV